MEASRELEDALAKIRHCTIQLSDEQIWSRPTPELNSIGNLLLHLAGNLTQWIVCGIGGAEDRRDRRAEFAETGPIPRADLLGRLETAVSLARLALENVTAEDLFRVRRIQGFDVSGLAAIFHSVPHFRGHTQELVHITRVVLGDAYQIQWHPQTAEQGA